MSASKRDFFLVFLISVSIVSATTSFTSDEDSGSIEIPDRPENRQEMSQNSPKDDKSFLNLISKVMGSFKGSFQTRAQKISKKSDWKYMMQKTKKALNRVNKAYVHVDKARKKLFKNGF